MRRAVETPSERLPAYETRRCSWNEGEGALEGCGVWSGGRDEWVGVGEGGEYECGWVGWE